MRHVDDLKQFDKECHDGIVFDDMSFENWPAGSVIHLVDLEHDAPIHCRYNNVVIPAGTPRMFTSNKPEIFWGEGIMEEQRDAIERRLFRVAVTEDIRVGPSDLSEDESRLH